ncbi:FH1/FH2 domain-containing protein 3-like [Scyliorhinus canicula]|uniref:FH1/FH2 domain-containing protein 3-like n=1 Tax=Scyliorhinus canicula TaxID=7830 RepID=UPI0018F561CF|nr:FH1/FH2 domain-containing protein 3-like [Scyliorhinus canicula]
MKRGEMIISKAAQSSRPQAPEAPPTPFGQRPGRLPAAALQAEGDGDCWEPTHEQCRRELLEARSLAANLEKTVRWWSECSARWKEKWAKANLEKVRCRRECQLLRQKVKGLQREVGQLRAALEEKEDDEEEAGAAEIHIQERGQRLTNVHDKRRGERGERRSDHQETASFTEGQGSQATKEEDPGGVLAARLTSKCSLRSAGGPRGGQGMTECRTGQQGESPRVTRDGLLVPGQHGIQPVTWNSQESRIWRRTKARQESGRKLEVETDFKFEDPGTDPREQEEEKQSIRRKQELTVLELKRSNLINIGLAALPAPYIVRAALLSFDQCVLEREAIERLLTMVPTEDELRKIRDAQQASPHLSLGSAEQFLLTLASISELQARLQLWSFKMEYDTMEKDIAEPLFNLKLGMEQLAGNRTFHCILATLLAIGNFLNGVNAKGFELSYLEKVPGVKDTVHKQPLLYHACSIIHQNFPDTTDLCSEITAITLSAKVDFAQLQTDLARLEHNCKAAWDHLKAIAKRDSSPVFKSKLPAFLKECAQRIIILKAVQRRIRNRFHSFLLYFGYPSSCIRKMTVGKFCKLISGFALEYHTTRAQILQQKEKQDREQERLQREECVQASCTDSPLNIATVIRSMYPEVSRQHEHMTEILNTPERTRKYDSSLPRSRSKKVESTGFAQSKFPW